MGIATTTLSIADLLNFSQGIAQLNLGYLGISVAILGGLGGVFVYFNIKPLKDGLVKQEKSLEQLRKEAHELLGLAKKQSNETIESFRITQAEEMSAALGRQEEKIALETTNKIQEIEKTLVEKIGEVSEAKDVKLKTIILSEANNLSASLEKSLTSTITTTKETTTKEISELKQQMATIKSLLKNAEENIKELQVYKFSKEGQMGAIIYSVDLLKDAIDEFLQFKKAGAGDIYDWKVKNRLHETKKHVTGYILEPQYIASVEAQLVRIENEPKFKELVAELRSSLKTG